MIRTLKAVRRNYLSGRYIEMWINAAFVHPRIISAEQTRDINIVYKLYKKGMNAWQNTSLNTRIHLTGSGKN